MLDFAESFLMIFPERTNIVMLNSARLVSVCVLNIRFVFVVAVFLLPGLAQAGDLKTTFPVLEPPVQAQNFTGIAPGFSTPPDTNGAVGPNHLMIAINGTVRVQDRSGTILSTITLNSFWSGLGVTDTFDPRSFFDPYSQRFIIITCAERRSGGSSMLFGVSATDDPTGIWHRWRLDADSANIDWVDYGNLGFTTDEITFTGNMFSIAADAFNGVRFWRINKASALSGGPLTMETFTAFGAGGTLVPVQTMDPGQTTQYIVRTGTSNLFGAGRAQVYRLTGPLGATTLSIAPNAAIGLPWSVALPDAPQLGTAARIQTNDDRIQTAVYKDGYIWCAHTVGMPAMSPDRTGARWWQIHAATGIALQDGILQDLTGKSFYYPSLVVNDQGLMVIGCSGSSATEYVSCYYAWRNPDSPLGALEGVQQFHAGVGPYTGPRWGDYTGTFLDPVDGTSVWVLQQYGEVSNRWGIQWVQLTINQLNTVAVTGRWGLFVLMVVMLSAGTYGVRRYIVGNGKVG